MRYADAFVVQQNVTRRLAGMPSLRSALPSLQYASARPTQHKGNVKDTNTKAASPCPHNCNLNHHHSTLWHWIKVTYLLPIPVVRHVGAAGLEPKSSHALS
jgi:hypothetical protein